MMDMKAIICLAALSANVAALPHAAPDALPAPVERRAAEPQFLPLSLSSVTAIPTPALSVASPSNILGQLTGILGSGSITIPTPTGITLPKDILTPATNAYLQDPVASLKLLIASLLNALQSGNTGSLGQVTSLLSPLKLFSRGLGTTGQVVKRQDDSEDVTEDESPDVTTQDDSPDVTFEDDSPDVTTEDDSPDDDVDPGDEVSEDPASEDDSGNDDVSDDDDSEDLVEDDAPVDEEDPSVDEDTPSDDDAPVDEDVPSEDDTPSDDTPSDDTPSDDTRSDDTPSEDTPSDDTPSDDTPSDDTPSDDTPSDDTPSDDTPSVDAPVDDTPTVDAPAEDVPADESITQDAAMKFMKRQIAVPSAALVPSGVSDSVALPGSFQPLADATPLAAVPASFAALNLNGGVASAVVPSALVSALANPTINTLAVVNSLDPLAPIPVGLIPSTAAAAVAAAASALAPPVKRDVQANDAQNLPDPAALMAQWIAAQAKPLLNEINNQIQAAPSVAANLAAAQASLVAAPASIAAAQIAAIPSNIAPVLSAANSIVADLQTGSVPIPIASILPDASALASAIVPVIPVQATATASVTLADGLPAAAASVGVQVPGVVSVGQNAGFSPDSGGIAPLPTVYPVVGSPSSQLVTQYPPQYKPQSLPSQLLPTQVLRSQVLPSQLLPSQILPSPLLPSQLLPSQPLPSLKQQDVPFAQSYPDTAQNQGTNSAIGTVNGFSKATAVATPTSQAMPAGELPKDEGQLAGANIIFDPLTQPLSPDNVSSLLKNQLYLQLAPLLLIFQSLVAASNPSFTLSSLLSSSPLLQDRGLLLSSPSLSSSPDPTSPEVDPIASAWLEGAKLLQSNSLVNSRVLNGASSQPDLLSSLLGSSASPSTTDVLNSLLNNPLNQKLTAKLSGLVKWSVDTQLKAQGALEELLAVLLS